MRTCAALAGLIIGAALSSPAVAEDMPSAVVCSFTAGSTAAYDGGKFTHAAAADLALEIDKIDLASQSAEVAVGTDGSRGRLAIARAIGANHFLEVVTEGFWNITTIFELDPATGAYPAVHSRHFGLLGQPMVTQYTGTCRAK